MPKCAGCCSVSARCLHGTWAYRGQSFQEARNTYLYPTLPIFTTQGGPKRTLFVTLAGASPCKNAIIFPTCCLLAVLLAFARGLIRQRATPMMLPYSVSSVKLLLRCLSALLNDSSCTETQLVQSLECNILCLFNTQSQLNIGLESDRFDSFI